MPLLIHPDLVACLDRENPRVYLVTEIAAPDVGQVLRRASDQFFTDTPTGPRESESPAASTVASASGALRLTGTALTLATRSSTLANNLDIYRNPNASKVLRCLRWQVDRALGPCLVRTFMAKVHRGLLFGVARPTRFQLQIYRATGALYDRVAPNGTRTPFVKWSFAPLLSPAAVVEAANITWASDNADVTFDLTNAGLVLDGAPRSAAGAGHATELTEYYFELTQLDVRINSLFTWRCDTASSQTEAGVGVFDRFAWERPTGKDTQEWARVAYGDIPAFTLTIEQFAPAGGDAEVVYEIDLGAVPSADSDGRIVFERATPPGTAAALELSTAGTGGPWTAVLHDGAVTTKQQVYHLRLTLTPDASQRRSPSVFGLGIEFRTAFDVTVEAIIDPLSIECSAPYLEGAIGEGSLVVIRTGRRDFDDTATMLASKYPTPKLEVDTWLASDHPLVTRDKWLHLDRAQVSNRVPTETGEKFTLLSYLTKLKRKIPRRIESINTVHTVVSATELQVVVTPVLQGTSAGGNEYDGRGYFMRVRTSAVAGVESGTTATITGSTDTTKLDFSPGLDGVLVAGNVVEVHSATFSTIPLQWLDTDPATIWWEILTVHLEIPPERIGLAQAGRVKRSGLPPLVTDIAPGDATTQAKRKVTFKDADQVEADKLIDQLSFIMGGATVVIAGQICFVQIYELRDGDGAVTVAPAPVGPVFGPEDYIGLQTPVGLEHRMTSVACNYGVSMADNPDEFPVQTTQWVDVDALVWLTQQDLDIAGAAEIPEDIARWLYNTEDEGAFLASELARQLVLIGSTGLRPWTFASRELRPDIVPGDSIALVTDQYTDYDPATATEIAGSIAARAVVIGVRSDRRGFTALVPGLAAIVQRGGKEGSITGGRKMTVRIAATQFTAFDPAVVRHDDSGIRPSPSVLVVSVRAKWKPPPGITITAVRARTFRLDVGSGVELQAWLVSDSGVAGAAFVVESQTTTGWDTIGDEALDVPVSSGIVELIGNLDSNDAAGDNTYLLWAEIDYVTAG